MNITAVKKITNRLWGNAVIPGLSEFIRIPAKSPAYDAKWQENGNLMAAANLLAHWAEAQNIPGLTYQILQLKNKTPCLYIDIPGYSQSQSTNLFYAHLDKMPESKGWDSDLGPWKPVIKNNRLYGRGSVDDGYALFTLITALKVLEKKRIPYNRTVTIIEASEESGSYDLPIYLKHLHKKIGTPNLIMCLDVGCGDYEHLWCTSSLRGIVEGTLQVEILNEPVHSGAISGIIPSSFRILRQLLDRIENVKTGEVLLKSCKVTIPEFAKKQAKELGKYLGKTIYTDFPLLAGVAPTSKKLDELLLNRTWKPTLSIIGAEGLPRVQDAATVLRPMTALQLSLRIPPFCDPEKVTRELTQIFEKNPPNGAKIKFIPAPPMTGWAAPKTSKWLSDAIENASLKYFGKKPMFVSEGGSIGVMPILQQQYPEAQFFLTGAAGPNSNEHGPNESLHLPTAKKITCCLAEILAASYVTGNQT